MGESSTARALRSTTKKEQPCRFGTVVRALWPNKPALNLAQRMGYTERGAQLLIDGQRKVTLDAVLVIVGEIRERK